MTRCKEFYDKWEEDPNWCEKCKSQVSDINRFLGFVDELEENHHFDKNSAKVEISETAIRPLLRLKDPIHRDKAISAVVSALNAPNKVARSTDGTFAKSLTTQEVKKIIRATARELKPP